MIEKTRLYYFSPTGGTRKVGEIFAGAFAEVASAETEAADIVKEDMTCDGVCGDPACGDRAPSAGGDPDASAGGGCAGSAAGGRERELVVVAAPVFGGRIPSVMRENLLAFDGAGRAAVAIVVYGNRDYDDALLELCDVLTDRGFRVIAAGAFVAQHSMMPDIAAGRPDAEDEAEIRDFAVKVSEKLAKMENAEDAAGADAADMLSDRDTSDVSGIQSAPNDPDIPDVSNIPGQRPYKPEMDLPFTPVSSDACVMCGKCAEVCPTGAIELKDGTLNTDAGKCIICMVCVNDCPEGARSLPDALCEKTSKMLEPFRGMRNVNEMFF